MKIIRRTIKGCTNLKMFGYHPGTIHLIAFPLIGLIAGADSGIRGSLSVAGMILLVILPMYLIGAYGRGKDHEFYENDTTNSN